MTVAAFRMDWWVDKSDRPPTYHAVAAPEYVAACDRNLYLDTATEVSTDSARRWNPCQRRACKSRLALLETSS